MPQGTQAGAHEPLRCLGRVPQLHSVRLGVSGFRAAAPMRQRMQPGCTGNQLAVNAGHLAASCHQCHSRYALPGAKGSVVVEHVSCGKTAATYQC
jgi:hypothetical protein